ncbi:signal peptidase II [Arthrobacter silviterrae]|uniref:Lipoprotein signal peptidase n=1 Tax=Arthrobacter silviterrae TaxID=2026658 RepID=A0ABX0DFW5_9MICC|nr:signal peptidase II [Arthrobacter silviterrae]MDQ0275799.1 signal peptidase II [Arthrobacter silviterrae]NGN83102.1 signal peptidase II [Arthrobacter silviterrae]
MSENSQQHPSSGPEDATDQVAAGRPPLRWGFLWTWLGFAALAYVCDQLTKLWVTSTMVEGQTTPVIPGVLQWYFIKNSGAAFSIGEGFTWFFTLIMAAVAVFIVVLARRIGSAWWAIGLGLLLGGALGNLTDRLFRPPSFGMGHVVDFISFPHFAIFNMADMGVVGGVITICLLTLIGVPLGGRAAVAAAKAKAAADAADAAKAEEAGPEMERGESSDD